VRTREGEMNVINNSVLVAQKAEKTYFRSSSSVRFGSTQDTIKTIEGFTIDDPTENVF
jgi:hypothetical protein